jgi:hypothetical protein
MFFLDGNHSDNHYSRKIYLSLLLLRLRSSPNVRSDQTFTAPSESAQTTDSAIGWNCSIAVIVIGEDALFWKQKIHQNL